MARLSQRGVMLALAGVYGATLTAQQAIVLAASNKYASLCDHHLDEILLAILCVGGGGVIVAPSVPTGITCAKSVLPSDKYTISWTNGANPQTLVEVWLNVNGAGYSLAATVGASDTSYLSVGPYIFGNTVCGKVRSGNGTAFSAFSTECCVNFF